MNAIYTFVVKIFDTSDFPARWSCGRWGAIEGWTHIVSDLVIFGSYVAIPTALFILLRNRRDIAFPRTVWLFIAFILACGIGHGVESTMFWWSAYRVTAVIKAITAAVSVATVVALVRTLPRAIAIPSLVREHNQMAVSLRATHEANAALAATRRELERRTAELVVRDRRLQSAMTAVKACAISWDADTAKILWEMGFQAMLSAAEIGAVWSEITWERLIGADAKSKLMQESARTLESGRVTRLSFPMKGYEEAWMIRVAMTPEPPVAGHPPAMVGMVGMVPVEG